MYVSAHAVLITAHENVHQNEKLRLREWSAYSCCSREWPCRYLCRLPRLPSSCWGPFTSGLGPRLGSIVILVTSRHTTPYFQEEAEEKCGHWTWSYPFSVGVGVGVTCVCIDTHCYVKTLNFVTQTLLGIKYNTLTVILTKCRFT